MLRNLAGLKKREDIPVLGGSSLGRHSPARSRAACILRTQLAAGVEEDSSPERTPVKPLPLLPAALAVNASQRNQARER